MRKCFAVLVIAAAALLMQPLTADAIIVGTNPDVHFDFQGQCANDFHIEGMIHSAEGSPPTVEEIFVAGDPVSGNWTVSGYSLVQQSPEDWWFTADFVTNGQICYCQWIHFGILFDVNCYNVIIDLHGWWTQDGDPINAKKKDLGAGIYDSDVVVTGFHVDDIGRIRPGQQTLRIHNNTDIDIDVSILELAVGRERVPLNQMNEDYLGQAGTGQSPHYSGLVWHAASIPSPHLAPGEYFDIHLEDLEIHLVPGDFFHIRGKQDGDASAPAGIPQTPPLKRNEKQDPWSFFWEQHEAHHEPPLP
ncbi:MAG: hypothetical protein GY835_01400 [bacterium]|nr:hypothetical protein [bacterium]